MYNEVRQLMSTGMSHEEAIEEVLYWMKVEKMLRKSKWGYKI